MNVKCAISVIAVLSIIGASATAQKNTKPAKTQASGSSTPASRGSQVPSSETAGFSIETEMFTYKAVEENSALIACDVARYLYGDEVTSLPPDAHVPCVTGGPAQPEPGIILLSADSTLLSYLQVWQTDMDFMVELETRAKQTCVPCAKGSGLPACAASPDTNGNRAPAGVAEKGFTTETGESIFSLAVQAIARNEAISPVGGTVGNNALMNEVTRQLRALKVQVLIPDVYSPSDPFSHHETSPYFTKLDDLSNQVNVCIEDSATYGANDPRKTAITNIINDIQAFGRALSYSPSTNQDQTASSATPHIVSVLRADRVAQKLFSVGSPNGSTRWQYLLLLQALESGGSVLHTSNLLVGTRVSFSGGAVDTYTIFHADGEVACSGNVYNFQAPVRTKDLDKAFRKRVLVNPSDVPELQSTCPLQQ